MQRRNWIGALACASLFVGGFLLADGSALFVNGFGLLIVLSGTLGAAMLSYPFDSLAVAARVGWNAYSTRPPSPDEIVGTLIKVSVRSRYDGFLALQRFENETTVTFLKNALELVVDGYRREEIREILSTELVFFRKRRAQHERVFRHLSRLAPAFGVAGSVIGLMSMVAGVDEPVRLLSTVPLALTSTLYGIVLANFLLIPIAEKIHHKTSCELLAQQLVIDGVMAVVDEQNPHKLETRLKSFLTPAERVNSQRSLDEIRRLYAEARPLDGVTSEA